MMKSNPLSLCLVPVFSTLLGSLSYYSTYYTDYVVTNISCSSTYIGSCSFSTTRANCSAYGGIAILSCRRGKKITTTDICLFLFPSIVICLI